MHCCADSAPLLADSRNGVASGSVIETIPVEVAREKYGPFADALAIDQQVSSTATRRTLGWNPTREFTSSIDEQWIEYRASI